MNIAGLVRFAWRDLRGSTGAAVIIVACLLLGVTVVTAIGSLRQAVGDAIEREARTMLGGDAVIEIANRELDPDELVAIVPDGAEVVHSVVTNAIASAANGRRVAVSLKAVGDAYPIYGALVFDPPRSVAEVLHGRGVAVEPALLQRLGIAPGDILQIAGGEVVVRATLLSEPDRMGGFVTLGPRLLMHETTLAELGVLAPGALARHYYSIRLPNLGSAEDFVQALRRSFPDAAWRAQSVADLQPRIARNADRLAAYLSVAGIAALLIGGLGVGIVVDAHLKARRAGIATMRCLGATQRDIAVAYAIQIVMLCSLALVAGAMLGTLLPRLLHFLPAGTMPIPVELGIYPEAIAQSALVSLASAALFTAFPLLRAAAVTPAALFRDDRADTSGLLALWPLMGLALVVAILVLATLLSVPRPSVALAFLGITGLALIAMLAAARLALNAVGRLGALLTGLPRLALLQLQRAESSAVASVIALTAGTAVLATVILIEHSILRELESGRALNAPSAIFIDIQPGQRETFEQLVAETPGAQLLQLEPVLRARVVRIAGQSVDEAGIAENVRWTVRRDRGLSYRATPATGAVLTAGSWWPPDYAGPPLVSVEEEVALGYGVGIGDTLTFNVLGRLIDAEIANLRADIEWSEGRVDFVFILSPGVIEAAPHTLVATVDLPAAEQAGLFDRVAAALPNVTPFSIEDVVARVESILTKIGFVVRLMAVITLVTGLAVLTSALVAARRAQLRQSVLLKVVGAEHGQIRRMFLLQYLLIGAVAAVLGLGIGIVTSWAVARFAIGVDWAPWSALALLVPAIATGATMALGALSLRRVLAVPAAAILRGT